MSSLSLMVAGLLALAQAAPTTPPGSTTYPTRPPDPGAATGPDRPLPPDPSGTRITPDGTRSTDPNDVREPATTPDPKASDMKRGKPR